MNNSISIDVNHYIICKSLYFQGMEPNPNLPLDPYQYWNKPFLSNWESKFYRGFKVGKWENAIDGELNCIC